MSISVLIAVESCDHDRARGYHHAIRQTWFRDICVTDKRFFYGDIPGYTYMCPDEVALLVDDSYQGLPAKTQKICGWAFRNGFDYMFKCDNDTLVNPWNFMISFDYDYVGGENADINVPGFPPQRIEFASGGAGYWLSSKAMEIVAKTEVIGTAEDVFVAHALLQHSIRPHFHPGYKWRPGSVLDKETVTFHLSSALQKKYEPAMMVEYYEKLKRMVYE